MNEEELKRRSFANNKLNLSVAEQLQKKGLLYLFDDKDDPDDTKKITPEQALQLFQTVYIETQKLNWKEKDVTILQVYTKRETQDEHRVSMENILKDTNGVGATFYDLNDEHDNTRGLWIIPTQKFDILEKQ